VSVCVAGVDDDPEEHAASSVAPHTTTTRQVSNLRSRTVSPTSPVPAPVVRVGNPATS
jgi:hypothetical protein